MCGSRRGLPSCVRGETVEQGDFTLTEPLGRLKSQRGFSFVFLGVGEARNVSLGSKPHIIEPGAVSTGLSFGRVRNEASLELRPDGVRGALSRVGETASGRKLRQQAPWDPRTVQSLHV